MKNRMMTLAGTLPLLAVLGNLSVPPLLAQVRPALVKNVDEPGRSPYQVLPVSSNDCGTYTLSKFPRRARGKASGDHIRQRSGVYPPKLSCQRPIDVIERPHKLVPGKSFRPVCISADLRQNRRYGYIFFGSNPILCRRGPHARSSSLNRSQSFGPYTRFCNRGLSDRQNQLMSAGTNYLVPEPPSSGLLFRAVLLGYLYTNSKGVVQ